MSSELLYALWESTPMLRRRRLGVAGGSEETQREAGRGEEPDSPSDEGEGDDTEREDCCTVVICGLGGIR